MTLTLNDIAKIAGRTVKVVQKWRGMGMPGKRIGKLTYVESDEWGRWANANLYRSNTGKLRKRYALKKTRPADADAAYRAASIAELAEISEDHPVAQARRFVRVSTYAARVEQGQPIFGEAC